MRLAQIVEHPAFVALRVTERGQYRLEMTDPVNLAWSATGSLRWVLDKSDELPLLG